GGSEAAPCGRRREASREARLREAVAAGDLREAATEPDGSAPAGSAIGPLARWGLAAALPAGRSREGAARFPQPAARLALPAGRRRRPLPAGAVGLRPTAPA